MKKLITTATTLVSIALFTGGAFAANGELDQDILHGAGQVEASSFVPYVGSHRGPQGTEDDVLSNLDKVRGSSGTFTPYVQVEGDRDNVDDLIDNV